MSIKLPGRGMGWALLAALLLANLCIGARLYSQEISASEPDDAYTAMKLFAESVEQVRHNYVDADRVSYKDLIYSALQGMMENLDPHSQFMDEQTYDDMKDDTAGQFGGLGIVISVKDASITIIAPMEDTPGFRAGLLAGDKILEIDGQTAEGMALGDAVKKLRGEPGTKVRLKVLSSNAPESRTVEIERAIIKVESVKDARILGDGIGYMRIATFNDPTADALQDKLDVLTKDGMKALVLDLRNNPGGLLTSAIDASEKFLRKNDEIVSVIGRDPSTAQIYKAKGSVHRTDFPMAILVNSGSASAAEIMAGALQDNKRAVLIGEKTFGKGSVQSVLPMQDGTALRITTAKYYTPSHRVIHDHGIEPDIVVPMSPEDWRAILMKRSHPEDEADQEATVETGATNEVQDIQLERAVDVLKGIMAFTARLNGAPKWYASPVK